MDELSRVIAVRYAPREEVIEMYNQYLSEQALYEIKAKYVSLSGEEKLRRQFCKRALVFIHKYYVNARDEVQQ